MVFKEGNGLQRGMMRGQWSSKMELVPLWGHTKRGRSSERGVVLKGSSGPKEGSGPLTSSLKEGSGPQREQWSKRGKWSPYKVTQRREWSSKMLGPYFQCSSVQQHPIHPTKGNSSSTIFPAPPKTQTKVVQEAASTDQHCQDEGLRGVVRQHLRVQEHIVLIGHRAPAAPRGCQ